MSDFIDTSYFSKGDMLIPGLGQPEGVKKLNELIDKYEPDFLKHILGYSFHKLFMAGLESDDDPPQSLEDAEIAQRWKDLRDGAEYSNAAGHTRKWTGFINDELRSPIANYVYFYFIKGNQPVTTVSGEKSAENTKSVNVTPSPKLIRAWNEMVDFNHSLVDFLLNKKEAGVKVYPEFDPYTLDVTEYNNLMTKISFL